MKTHENRTLLSKVLLRATTCLLLTSGIGISPAFAVADLANTVRTERMQQQKVSVSGVVKDKNGEPIIGASILQNDIYFSVTSYSHFLSFQAKIRNH